MGKVKVSTALLAWALERAGKSAASLKPAFPHLEDWLKGTKLPTLRQLEAFAKQTHAPLGYLFLENPPTERCPITLYRTINGDAQSKISVDLLDTIQDMERRQDWYREYLIQEGQVPLSYAGAYSAESDPRLVAEQMLQVLGLSAGWAIELENWRAALRVLRKAMQEAGVLVFTGAFVGLNTSRVFQVSEFRGFVLVDEYAPLVFVNTKDAMAAQMFTLAHELAHIFLGRGAAFDLRSMQAAEDPVEQACNRIAAEFLVPESSILNDWPKVEGTPDPFESLARLFKVSPLVIARRALDLGLASRSEFFEYYERYISEAEQREAERKEESKAKSMKGGPDFYVVHASYDDRGFIEAVARAAYEGKLLYSDAYSLTGYYGDTFKNYIDRVLAA